MAIYKIQPKADRTYVIYQKKGWFRGWEPAFSYERFFSIGDAREAIKKHERNLEREQPIYVYTGKDADDGW